MAMNPLCYPVVMATVSQLAVLTLKMQVCSVMEQLLNLLQPNLLQVKYRSMAMALCITFWWSGGEGRGGEGGFVSVYLQQSIFYCTSCLLVGYRADVHV